MHIFVQFIIALLISALDAANSVAENNNSIRIYALHKLTIKKLLKDYQEFKQTQPEFINKCMETSVLENEFLRIQFKEYSKLAKNSRGELDLIVNWKHKLADLKIVLCDARKALVVNALETHTNAINGVKKRVLKTLLEISCDDPLINSEVRVAEELYKNSGIPFKGLSYILRNNGLIDWEQHQNLRNQLLTIIREMDEELAVAQRTSALLMEKYNTFVVLERFLAQKFAN